MPTPSTHLNEIFHYFFLLLNPSLSKIVLSLAEHYSQIQYQHSPPLQLVTLGMVRFFKGKESNKGGGGPQGRNNENQPPPRPFRANVKTKVFSKLEENDFTCNTSIEPHTARSLNTHYVMVLQARLSRVAIYLTFLWST